MNDLLTYEIRTAAIVKELQNQGFKILSTDKSVWQMEAPADISKTKARKLIDTTIKLYTAAKKLNYIQREYEALINILNEINLAR